MGLCESFAMEPPKLPPQKLLNPLFYEEKTIHLKVNETEVG